MYPNLKLQLWKSGMKQNRLAKILHMDETLLSRIVNGYREPNADLRASIAALLHCDQVWLFKESESETDPAPNGREGGNSSPIAEDYGAKSEGAG